MIGMDILMARLEERRPFRWDRPLPSPEFMEIISLVEFMLTGVVSDDVATIIPHSC